jgi:hypothetical protein
MSDDECAVCRDPLRRKIASLACKHRLHVECALGAIACGNLTCPHCRAPITAPFKLKKAVREYQRRRGMAFTDFSFPFEEWHHAVADDDPEDDDNDVFNRAEVEFIRFATTEAEGYELPASLEGTPGEALLCRVWPGDTQPTRYACASYTSHKYAFMCHATYASPEWRVGNVTASLETLWNVDAWTPGVVWLVARVLFSDGRVGLTDRAWHTMNHSQLTARTALRLITEQADHFVRTKMTPDWLLTAHTLGS